MQEIGFVNGRVITRDKKKESKVNPIAENLIKECRAAGLTLEEFHVLAQLISWEYEKVKKEREKKWSSEIF